MRHHYTIGDCKTHLGTAGNKEGILAHEEREQREALGDNIPNDGEQQQLTLAIFFTVKGTGSGFSWPVSKKKKLWKTETETSSTKSMEVVEVAVDAAVARDTTEL